MSFGHIENLDSQFLLTDGWLSQCAAAAAAAAAAAPVELLDLYAFRFDSSFFLL
jgi:hypothetical protein